MTLIILMYALFAGSISMGKIILSYSGPIFVVGARMFVAGIILLAYQYFSPQQHFKLRKKDLFLYAQIIFFGVYLNYILRFWALKDLASSKTAFLFNISPFISAIYAYLFFKEKITKKQFLGLTIGFLGLIPILRSSSSPEQQLGEFLFLSWQEIAVLVSVACHSYSWIVMRKLVRKRKYSPMMVNGLTMTAGGFLALITSYFVEGPFPVTQPGTFIGWLLLIILVSNILCHNIYGYLLKKHSPTFLSFAGFLMPLFTALYGWAFLHETISYDFYLSSAIVFCGLLLFYQDELRNVSIIETV